jgi:hypothetical protein
MAKLFILSYSDAVSFRDIRGHLETITSIVAKNQKEGTLGWVNMGNDL